MLEISLIEGAREALGDNVELAVDFGGYTTHQNMLLRDYLQNLCEKVLEIWKKKLLISVQWKF